MSETPPEAEDGEDTTTAAPAPGGTSHGPISAADDDQTDRMAAPGYAGPTRDQLQRTPVPYAPAHVPAPAPSPTPYGQPGFPAPGTGSGASMPTAAYVPTHAYEPTPPPYEPPPPPYAPPAPPFAPPEPPPPDAPPFLAKTDTPAGYEAPVFTPPTPPRQDGVATAALICSILGIPLLLVACLGVPFCITGIIMGFISRHRIALSHDKLAGGGAAIAAIVIGAVGIAFFVLLLASFLVSPGSSGL